MIALVIAVQLFEREFAARRQAAIAAARASTSPAAALVAPLEEPRLPEIPDEPLPDGPAAGEREYVVRPGDTLAKIAKRELGREDAWRAIYERNRAGIRDPARLQVGTTLRIPSREAASRAARELTRSPGVR
jgi:nucleoid-associated protein YgaU